MDAREARKETRRAFPRARALEPQSPSELFRRDDALDGDRGRGGRGAGAHGGTGGDGVRAAVVAAAAAGGRASECVSISISISISVCICIGNGQVSDHDDAVLIPRPSARPADGRHQPCVRDGPAALRERGAAQRSEIRRPVRRAGGLSGVEAEHAHVGAEAVLGL